MKAGQLIQDGTVTWMIDDVRDGVRVGDIILRPTLRDGFIKANGATVKASEYPRLLAWAIASGMTVTAEQYATDCSKYVYDEAADTLILPNAVGRVLQGGESVKSVEAGLPDATGTLSFVTWQNLNEIGKGAFKPSIHNAGVYPYDAPQGHRAMSDFKLSYVNPIYGRSSTVQPPAIELIPQIKY